MPPPNPLIQRNHIPLNSPKFGKNSNYIKINPFIPEELEKEEFNKNLIAETVDEKFNKSCDLAFYVNNPSMLE